MKKKQNRHSLHLIRQNVPQFILLVIFSVLLGVSVIAVSILMKMFLDIATNASAMPLTTCLIIAVGVLLVLGISQVVTSVLQGKLSCRMELIRPMYCIHEDDIIAWQRYNGLEFIQCACRFTERAAAHGNDGSSSKRQEVKLLLRELRRTNPDIEKSIFHSIHSVCLDTMVGYKSGGVEHTFADCYRERGEMAEMEKEDAE